MKKWVERQYLIFMLKRAKKMRAKLAKEKKEEAVIKAKVLLKEVQTSMHLEHNGVELTPELIDLLNDDETIEITEIIINELENMYVNKRVKRNDD